MVNALEQIVWVVLEFNLETIFNKTLFIKNKKLDCTYIHAKLWIKRSFISMN